MDALCHYRTLVQHTFAALFTQLPVHSTVYVPQPTAPTLSPFPERAPNSPPTDPSSFPIPQLATLFVYIYDNSPKLLLLSDN